MNTIGTSQVLVVEDDPGICTLLCEILEQDGYHVDCVSTLRETIRPEWLTNYEGIILDRRLPDGTADEFLPQIRDLVPDAYVIVATDYADLDDAIMAMRHGASDYILKPINAELLRASLSRCRRLQSAQSRVLQTERLAAIGTVVASVAHESRNVLQRILGRVELIRLSRPDDDGLLVDLVGDPTSQ